jgi:hypothetical protein
MRVAALLIVCVCVSPGLGTQIFLEVEYAGSFDSAFNPIGTPLDASTHVPGAYHQFDVFATLSGLDPGEDLAVVIFDMVLGAGMTPSDVPWIANPELIWDPPGPANNVPIFSENSDPGDDLKAIVVIAANGNNYGGVHNRRPGVPGPTNLGSAFLFWDGTKPSSVGVGANPNISDPFATVIGNVLHIHPASAMSFGPPYEIFIVEHFTVGEVNLGDTKRGTSITATLPYSFEIPPIIWTLDSFIGPNGPVVGASLNSETGEFSWDSAGAPLGGYTAVISAVDFGGAGQYAAGQLSFVLVVPEPGSIAFAGTAMAFLVAIRWRATSPRYC